MKASAVRPRATDSPGSQHPVKQRPAGRVCVRCSATGAGPDAGRTRAMTGGERAGTTCDPRRGTAGNGSDDRYDASAQVAYPGRLGACTLEVAAAAGARAEASQDGHHVLRRRLVRGVVGRREDHVRTATYRRAQRHAGSDAVLRGCVGRRWRRRRGEWVSMAADDRWLPAAPDGAAPPLPRWTGPGRPGGPSTRSTVSLHRRRLHQMQCAVGR